jgi:acyl transferase domain-containing protein
MKPIAVVGLGCRFPKAQCLGEYWDLLLAGSDCISDIPAERWSTKAHIKHLTPSKAGLVDKVQQFDPQFFRLPSLLWLSN